MYRYRLQQSHIKALYWTRLAKFITSASSFGPWMGKFSSSSELKKTRLNERSSGPILYDEFVGDIGVGLRWPLKSSWGRAYQQSQKGTSAISSAML
jgi:hypothetical protein